MRKRLSLLLFTAGIALAQQTVAPSPDASSTRGENAGDYNYSSSLELGYRFANVSGNGSEYRSQVNYGNGIRLLGGSLSMFSRDGHGKLFDELLISTQGLGNDPYQYASLQVRKNRWYRYDMVWRLNDYVNPAFTISFGEHAMNTTHRLQDHNLILLPLSKFRVITGYSRSTQTGPALSTSNLPSLNSGDEFAFFANVRRTQDEYRAGFEWQVGQTKLTVVRAWEFFRDDTGFALQAPSAGNNATDQTTLTSFNRTEPYHGETPSWRVALFRDQGDWLALNGRFTYAATGRNFIQDESAIGAQRFGNFNRQVSVIGDGRRTVTAANLNVTLFPNSRLTVTDHGAFYQSRIDGNNTFLEVDQAVAQDATLNFQALNIRTFTNALDLNYRWNRALTLVAGYHVATRRIESVENQTFEGFVADERVSQNNILHSGVLGIRLKPIKGLSVNLDGEIGRANHPIYPTSEKDYHVLGIRAQYRRNAWTFTAMSKANYNVNSVSFSSYSSHQRQHSVNAAYAARSWLSFDAGYTKLHLDTLGGLAYFLNGDLITGDVSRYISNLHTLNGGVRMAFKKAEVYAGYSRVQDLGDSRGTPFGSGAGSALPALQAAQTFPLVFDSPFARLTIPLQKRLRLNLGYQHYRYREDFSVFQNYNAHTGFSSLTWSF